MLPPDIDSFLDEMEKVANPLTRFTSKLLGGGRIKPIMEHAISTIKGGTGRILTGAGIGAGAGAVTADPHLEGDTKTRAIRGALLGGLGGYAAPLATKAGRQAAMEGAKRIGKAQWHGLTGRGSMPINPGSKTKQIDKLRSAEAAGLTSIPGVIKGLAKNPRRLIGKAWKDQGLVTKGFAGLEGYHALPGLKGEDPTKGRAESGLKALGGAGSILLGSRMGILPSVLLYTGATSGLGALGKGIDRLAGTGPKRLLTPEEAAAKKIQANK